MLEKSGSERLFGLDIIRATAIVLVVLGHSRFMLQGTRLEGFPYVRMIDGVDMFFVLSGFLIGNIMLRQVQVKGYFSVQELLPFWKRRWFRTLPSYYLILLLNYVLVKSEIAAGDIAQFDWRFFFFLQNFSSPFHGFFWESWSLTIEEWFYLAFPIILVLAHKMFLPKQAFLVSVIVMLLFPLLYRAGIYDVEIKPEYFDLGIRKVVLTRLDSIGYGLLAAYFYQYYNLQWVKYRWAFFTIGVLMMMVILNLNPGLTTFYAQVFNFMVSPMSVMMLLPVASSIKQYKWRVGKIITHISKVSYAMYLLNLGILLDVIRNKSQVFGEAKGIGFFLVYWAVLIVLSTAMYHFYEKPMMDLRDKF